jgi:rSAM/selenodomain-associated transferase 2
MTPPLAIVVPVLDEAAVIAGTLAALAPLRARGAELLVVDGGSSDDTVRVSRPYADRVLHGARGRARQMNAGAAASSGAVLLFVHADTRLPEAADEAIALALRGGAQWGRFDVCIDAQSRMLRVVATCMNLRSRVTGIATGDQALFVTRALFDHAGGFPDQPLMEDIELSRRLKRHGAPACLRQRVVTSGRRWESRGVWRTIALMWRLRWLYWRGVPPQVLAEAYR